MYNMYMYTHDMYLKWITEDLLYGIGISAQYYVNLKWENKLKKNKYMFMYN